MRPATIYFALALVALLGGGCSGREPDRPAASEPATKASSQAPPRACTLVTAEEMSSIAGTTLTAEGEAGVGSTTCRYLPASGSVPPIEVVVDWGNGAVAMASFGALGRLEPGILDPLAGLGDQASQIGPVMMVRAGADLVKLSLWGVDDKIAAAKRVIDLMRPRMGPSAQSSEVAVGGGTGEPNVGTGENTDDVARAVGDLVGGLLDRVSERTFREGPAVGASGERGVTPAPSTTVDEPSLGPATGPPVRVPLVAGLTLVGAEHEPGRGDYEPIFTITSVTRDAVSLIFSANLPEGRRVSIDRAVRREDLQKARGYRSWYELHDPLVFAGTTAFSFPTAVLNDIKAQGRADVTRLSAGANPLVGLASLIAGAGRPSAAEHPGTLRRIEPHAVAFPVLLNDAPAELPAIHVRGTFDDATIDFHVLDDADNPLLLRVAGGSVGRIVRIAYPLAPAAPRIAEQLKTRSRVELHGIYFDFGKATLRPESEPVLRDVAAVLTQNPEWKVTIEGHTDNVGGDAPNLELSRRRADAVKAALVERHRVQPASLSAAGFGASRPTAPNNTLDGRARNRRVELVRQ